MKSYLLAAAVVSVLVSASAFAADSNDSVPVEDKAYVELGVATVITRDSGFSARNSIALVRAGYNFNKNFSGEVIAGGGDDASGYYGSTNVTFKINSVYGAYLKAKTEVTLD